MGAPSALLSLTGGIHKSDDLQTLPPTGSNHGNAKGTAMNSGKTVKAKGGANASRGTIRLRILESGDLLGGKNGYSCEF